MLIMPRAHPNSFPCNAPGCNKIFNDNRKLKDHRRSHSKKFKCPLCSYACGSSKHLIRHQRTHEATRYETCCYCGANQGRPDNFRRHLNRFHKGGLSAAAARGDEIVVRELLQRSRETNQMDTFGESPLHGAIGRGDTAMVKVLLDERVDTETEYFLETPLLFAAKLGHQNIVGLLLDAGANIDGKDFRCYTPLHYAAKYGLEGTTRLLLSARASVEARDYTGRTPLHMAAFGRAELVVKLLIEAGADLEAKDNDGWTALKWSLYCPRVRQLLLDAGAKEGD